MPVIDGYPRPDWPAIARLIPEEQPEHAHEHWCAVARAWMDATAEHLGAPYKVIETTNFLILSPLEARTDRLLQGFVEKAWKQILSRLDGVATDQGFGKRVIMLFHSQEAYYAYTSHFYQEGVHPLSSGVFLNAEYGHTAIPFYDLSETEATIAHELTHCYLRDLPIPLWLDEGLAVTIENDICSNRPLRMDAERMAEHNGFWNKDTIQEFWSGESFARVDEGNGLSYELARYCIRALAHELTPFIEFTRHANFADGGEAAAVEVFGGSLGGLIEQFFGPGDWSPRTMETEAQSHALDG